MGIALNTTREMALVGPFISNREEPKSEPKPKHQPPEYDPLAPREASI